MMRSIVHSLRSVWRAFTAAPVWCLVTAALGTGAIVTGWPLLSIPPFLVFLFVLYFFRSPWRETPEDPDLLYSSADGVVVRTGPCESGVHRAGRAQRVLVFMSPLDVHRNTAPLAAVVDEVRHIEGKFVPAYREGMESINERTSIFFGTGEGAVIVTQIAGILARRIVCRARPGTGYRQGEEFGLIRFGSANEIVFGDDWEIVVAPGQRVRAGLTVIARKKR